MSLEGQKSQMYATLDPSTANLSLTNKIQAEDHSTAAHPHQSSSTRSPECPHNPDNIPTQHSACKLRPYRLQKRP